MNLHVNTKATKFHGGYLLANITVCGKIKSLTLLLFFWSEFVCSGGEYVFMLFSAGGHYDCWPGWLTGAPGNPSAR
jgi:hypothetical protein